jgi:transcriptional regulator with XRE-family HTH domain
MTYDLYCFSKYRKNIINVYNGKWNNKAHWFAFKNKIIKLLWGEEKMFIGEKLRQIRIENEKKQEDLARYCKITPGSIGNFENGRRQPKRELILKFCEFFNIDESYFYGEAKEPDKVRQLINELIDNKIIDDADNIPDSVARLILDAIRMEIRMKKIKEEQE